MGRGAAVPNSQQGSVGAAGGATVIWARVSASGRDGPAEKPVPATSGAGTFKRAHGRVFLFGRRPAQLGWHRGRRS